MKETQEHFYTVGELTLKISNQIIDESEIDYIKSISGVNTFHPSWDEYLDLMPIELTVHLHLLKKGIIALGWYGKTASEITDKWNFYFSDGKVINFTNRGWGDLMSAIINKREGYEAYYF